jgi:hypothetical protein
MVAPAMNVAFVLAGARRDWRTNGAVDGDVITGPIGSSTLAGVGNSPEGYRPLVVAP